MKANRNFTNLIILQVILMLFTAVVFGWSLFQPHLILAPYTFAVIILFQTFSLIQFIRRSNKKLTLFMEWIKNEGLSERFSKLETDGSHQQLNNAFNAIIEIIASSRAEKESGQFYFDQALGAMGTSIISFSNGDEIDIFNPAAQKLLNCKTMRTMEEFRENFPGFAQFISEFRSSEQASYKMDIGNSLHVLSTKCVDFRIRDKKIRLISFQDISGDLANEELEVWQKMIRVLRHEIMNSVTPIKSLTSTLIRMISSEGKPKSQSDFSDESISNIHTGLQAIEKRNQGMLNFVKSYQDLSKIKTPEFSQINISDLFKNLATLFSEEINTRNIEIEINIHPVDLQINADEKLITQVMMNLVKNAVEALENKDDGKITLKALAEKDSSVVIQVSDNGAGISKDIIDQIFIPFFTTKTEGSGIGLSLSRQIMWLHQGRISVRSIEEDGTSFTLWF